MGDDECESADEAETDRRRLLQYGGLAALLGAVGVGAGSQLLGGGSDATDATPTTDAGTPSPTTTDRTPTTTAAGDDWLPLVERFAPDLYFGARERWYPTDPRPSECRADDDHVVDGIPALLEYDRAFQSPDDPPNPTVFYNPVEVGDDIVALQYWMYSVFDQFAVNFHWHDWELLQVFVDVETDAVVLLSASAHARSVPNNEFLRPDLGPGDRPVVLSEVGSHSSATDVNASRPSFERHEGGSIAADVTNDFLQPLSDLVDQPFAYGLPRDEGARVPYSLPELDGAPLHEHLGIDLAAFVDQDVTVRSWRDLARPPAGLPTREPGLTMTHPDSRTEGDVTYDLVHLDEAKRCIGDFDGRRLSFEFSVPGFVEEAVAGHITSAKTPWETDRYTDPAGDVTDPKHRRAITGEAPAGLTDRVVGAVSVLRARSDGYLGAVDPDDREDVASFAPVSGFPLSVEVACLLRSDPVATVTSGGVFRFLHVEPGRHELVVNGPGVAPYAERFDHGGGTVRPGVGGRVTLVSNEDAILLRGDRRDSTGVSRVRIRESFAGPVFDARPVEPGRFAVPVHRNGEYTVEVTDDDGLRGVVRVDPEALDGGPVTRVETGKAALARELAELLADAASVAREFGGGGSREQERSVALQFEAAAADARAVAEVAAGGDGILANERVRDVFDRLDEVRDVLSGGGQGGYTDAAASLLRHRAGEARDLAGTVYSTPVAGR